MYKKYLLPTRGCKNYLEEIDENTYKLIPEIDCLRVIYQENNKDIFAVDPPDGPFMTVGEFEFNGKTLKEINFDNCCILKFE